MSGRDGAHHGLDELRGHGLVVDLGPGALGVVVGQLGDAAVRVALQLHVLRQEVVDVVLVELRFRVVVHIRDARCAKHSGRSEARLPRCARASAASGGPRGSQGRGGAGPYGP